MGEGRLPSYMGNPDAERRKKINARSAKQEAAHAASIGGRVQPGSGSSKRAPQDVRGPLEDGEGVLVQMKEYATGRYTLNEDEMAAIKADASRTGRDAQMIIDFPNRGVRLTIDIGDIP